MLDPEKRGEIGIESIRPIPLAVQCSDSTTHGMECCGSADEVYCERLKFGLSCMVTVAGRDRAVETPWISGKIFPALRNRDSVCL